MGERQGFDRQGARPAEGVVDNVARTEVTLEKDLNKLWNEFTEVGMKAVNVLCPLTLRKLALRPRELKIDVLVERLLRQTGHLPESRSRAGSRRGARLNQAQRQRQTRKPSMHWYL